MPGPWRLPISFCSQDFVVYFNLRRDARPLATRMARIPTVQRLGISISDEMPGPWRLPAPEYWMCIDRNFNLRRDARPLATSGRLQLVDAYHEFQSQTRCQAPGDSERNIGDQALI